MAKRKKNRKAVLVTSCVMAALIVASSSFAWFTSKDEVTNRLTATADYGVSIVEDFTPPKDMTPGQTVNKDVAAVNTGAVDAFVRLKLENAVDFTRYTSQSLNTAYSSGKTYYSDPSTGTISSSDMTGEEASGTVPSGNDYQYDLRVFTTTTQPSAASGTELVTLNPVEQVNSDGTTTANEVTTLMAGGKVVVAASTAVAPEYQDVRSGDDTNGSGTGFAVIYTGDTSKHMIKSGSDYHVLTTDQNGYYVDQATPVVADSNDLAGLKVEGLAHDYSGTGQYELAGNGLYLFKRTTSNGTTEHSGFYYYNETFYALKTKTENTNSTTTPYVDGTITYESGSGKNPNVVKSVANVYLLSTQHYTTPSNGAFTVALTDTKGGSALNANYNTATYMTVTHHVTADNNDTDKDIIFYVKLANNWNNSWTYVPANVTNGTGYFYYNTKLESGQTSKNLIDSVELADTMTSQHYLDMTYDLKVALDSVQVTKDEHDNETMTAVPNTWAAHAADYNGDGAFDAEVGGDGIIDAIQWTTT